jgi:hypothetical protein
MGASAGIAYLSNHFLGNPNPAIGVRNKVVQGNRALKDQIAQATQIPTLPPAPNAAADNGQAAQAMSLAAQRQRRIAQAAGGFSNNILTSPTGAAAAVTTRKKLLGE